MEIREKYAAGICNSTDDIEQDDVRAGTVDKNEIKTKAGHWSAGHESWADARHRLAHDRSHEATHDAKHAAADGAADVIIDNAGPTVAKHFFAEHAVEQAFDIVSEASFLFTAGTALYGIGKGVAKDFAEGDELHARSDVDGRDNTMTTLLDLDPGFKSAQYSKFPDITDATASRYRDGKGELTELGKQRVPAWQSAADAGAKAAFDAQAIGGRDTYLKTHPDVAARLKSDIAFNKGFENAMFVSNDPAKLAHLKASIEQRDARASSPMAVRG